MDKILKNSISIFLALIFVFLFFPYSIVLSADLSTLAGQTTSFENEWAADCWVSMMYHDQSFKLDQDSNIFKIAIKGRKKGMPADKVYAEIREDSNGLPDAVVGFGSLEGSSFPDSLGEVEIEMDSPVHVGGGKTYHLYLRPAWVRDASNCIFVSGTSAGDYYLNGVHKYRELGDIWHDADKDLYFKIIGAPGARLPWTWSSDFESGNLSDWNSVACPVRTITTSKFSHSGLYSNEIHYTLISKHIVTGPWSQISGNVYSTPYDLDVQYVNLYWNNQMIDKNSGAKGNLALNEWDLDFDNRILYANVGTNPLGGVVGVTQGGNFQDQNCFLTKNFLSTTGSHFWMRGYLMFPSGMPYYGDLTLPPLGYPWNSYGNGIYGFEFLSDYKYFIDNGIELERLYSSNCLSALSSKENAACSDPSGVYLRLAGGVNPATHAIKGYYPMQRKLWYFRSSGCPGGGGNPNHIVFGSWARGGFSSPYIALSIGLDGGQVGFTPYNPDNPSEEFKLYTDGKWRFLEIEIKENSAIGVPDGEIRVWAEGRLALDKRDVKIRIQGDDANLCHLNYVQVGDQVNRGDFTGTDEYRYWDDVVISDAGYIGPMACPKGQDLSFFGGCYCGGSPSSIDSSNVFNSGYCCNGTWQANSCSGEPQTNKYRLSDVSNLISKWHTADSTYDLNNDNIVNSKDLGLMMRNFSL